MKRILWATLLALPFCAQPARAQFCPPCGQTPIKIDGGIGIRFNIVSGCPRTQLGPWYQYWPYEAHFAMAPPVGGMGAPAYLTLPPQQVPPAQQWTPPAPTPAPGAPASPPAAPKTAYIPPSTYQPSVFQPVSYTTAVPAYWYNRQ
jgi:hypothetical protein